MVGRLMKSQLGTRSLILQVVSFHFLTSSLTGKSILLVDRALR